MEAGRTAIGFGIEEEEAFLLVDSGSCQRQERKSGAAIA